MIDLMCSFLTSSQQKVLKNCKELLWIVPVVLILSHGQASFESGFSINNSLLVENLSDRSLIAERIVSQAIHDARSVTAIAITPRMLEHVRSACSRCLEARELQHKLDSESEQKTKNKKWQQEMVEKLEKEVAAKRHTADAATKDADELEKKLDELNNAGL